MLAAISNSMMMEAIRSSETSVLTRVTRSHVPDEGILHIHRTENLESNKISKWSVSTQQIYFTYQQQTHLGNQHFLFQYCFGILK
jgi:hypothetical protein